MIDPSLLKLPSIDPDKLPGFTFTKDYSGDTFCAEVVDRLEDDKFLVQLGGGDGRDKIMAYIYIYIFFLNHFYSGLET